MQTCWQQTARESRHTDGCVVEMDTNRSCASESRCDPPKDSSWPKNITACWKHVVGDIDQCREAIHAHYVEAFSMAFKRLSQKFLLRYLSCKYALHNTSSATRRNQPGVTLVDNEFWTSQAVLLMEISRSSARATSRSREVDRVSRDLEVLSINAYRTVSVPIVSLMPRGRT